MVRALRGSNVSPDKVHAILPPRRALCRDPLHLIHDLSQACLDIMSRIDWDRSLARSRSWSPSEAAWGGSQLAHTSPHLLARAQLAWPAWNHAPIAAIRLSVPASELENHAGTQQPHRQSTNEQYWPGAGIARGGRQSGALGFGEYGPYQWHFLLRVCRLMLRRIAIGCRRLARVQLRVLWEIGRGRSEICRRFVWFGRCGFQGCPLCEFHGRRYYASRFNSILALRRPRWWCHTRRRFARLRAHLYTFGSEVPTVPLIRAVDAVVPMAARGRGWTRLRLALIGRRLGKACLRRRQNSYEWHDEKGRHEEHHWIWHRFPPCPYQGEPFASWFRLQYVANATMQWRRARERGILLPPPRKPTPPGNVVAGVSRAITKMSLEYRGAVARWIAFWR